MVDKSIVKILAENGLKSTPQRIAILEVLFTIDSHPTAETVNEYLRLSYPTISLSTIYKTLGLFSSKGILNIVHTDFTHARYDIIKDKHHHLYCPDSQQLEDFYDEDLDRLLNEYFQAKKIPGFTASQIQVQISGVFSDSRE